MNSKNTPYPKEYLTEMGAGIRYTDWILSGFRPWLRGTVCEVGAGTGNISRNLLDSGLEQLTLLEPDNGLFDVLKQQIKETPNVHISNSILADYATGREPQFDAFLYINVLEHIENDLDELRRIHSLLNPGGAALIFVPALPFLYSTYDQEVGHWRRYTKKDLKQKIEQAGFELREIRYFDFIGVFIWLLACKLLKLHPDAKKVGLYDRFLVPLSREIESKRPPLIGKNLLAIAVKQ